MKPLEQLDGRGIRAVLFDVDDTLTTGGKLTAKAYGALEALQRAGKRTVAVTGRPAAFCDYAARLWPVDAVVGENGGFYFWPATASCTVNTAKRPTCAHTTAIAWPRSGARSALRCRLRRLCRCALSRNRSCDRLR